MDVGMGGAPVVKFSEREENLLKIVWSCMKGVPEVDMAKFTELGGFQTAKTASNTWGVIKKKLGQIAEQNGGSSFSTTVGKKTPTPKKRGMTDGAGNGDDDTDETPSKKSRKTPAKKSKVKTEGDGKDDVAGGAENGPVSENDKSLAKSKRADGVVKTESDEDGPVYND